MHRNQPRNPILRIDTTRTDGEGHQEMPPDLRTPSPRLPLFQVSIDPGSPNQRLQPSVPSRHETPSHNANRALKESRKLLAHLLGQLQRRPLPPPAFEELKTNFDTPTGQNLGAIVETVKGAVNFKGVRRDAGTQQPSGPSEDEDEDEEKVVFSTDMTYDLMTQLKEVLGMTLLFPLA
jgi:hypothetical protein